MSVSIIGWSGTAEPGGGRECRAIVNGVRVAVRRNTTAVRWLCTEHGESVDSPQLCAHLRALAATPADPERNSRK